MVTIENSDRSCDLFIGSPVLTLTRVNEKEEVVVVVEEAEKEAEEEAKKEAEEEAEEEYLLL